MGEPDAKSVFETSLDAVEEARRDAVADAEIEAGEGVPHKRVREWLTKLSKGEAHAPPSK
jgi:hypothetical protein